MQSIRCSQIAWSWAARPVSAQGTETKDKAIEKGVFFAKEVLEMERWRDGEMEQRPMPYRAVLLYRAGNEALAEDAKDAKDAKDASALAVHPLASDRYRCGTVPPMVGIVA